MAQFVLLGDKYVNLDHVRSIEIRNDGALGVCVHGEQPMLVDGDAAKALLAVIAPAAKAGLKEMSKSDTK